MRCTVLGLSIGAAFYLMAPDVDACSGSECIEGYVYPSHGGTIPANTRGIIVRPAGDRFSVDPDEFDLTLFDAFGNAVPLRAAAGPWSPAFFLETGPLTPGAYDFVGRATPRCFVEDVTATFLVGDPAAEPTILGTLSSSPLEIGSVSVPESGACSTNIEAGWIDVHLELSDEAEPWRELLLVRTEVDGRPWDHVEWVFEEAKVGRSWRGHFEDRIFMGCHVPAHQTPYVGPGMHSVQMFAELPGTSISIATDPITIELSCDPPDPDPDPMGPNVPINPNDPMGGGLQLEDPSCGCRATRTNDRPRVGIAVLFVVAIATRRRTVAHQRRAADT